jgi:hypothetical protein
MQIGIKICQGIFHHIMKEQIKLHHKLVVTSEEGKIIKIKVVILIP